MEWDPGPGGTLKTLFEQAPLSDYQSMPERFRLEWGPIFYRGRTDGTARVIIVGQDPAADENVARRALVGDAGQRLQGYLRKLGLTRSYIIVNAFLYSIFGQFNTPMRAFMDRSTVTAWRNQLFDALVNPGTQAILAFGNAARHAVETWPGSSGLRSQGRVFELLHPTARPTSDVLTDWSSKLNAISAKVTADPDGQRDLSAYVGPTFKPTDQERIPHRDLGFGMPAWMGDGDMARRIKPSGSLPLLAKTGSSVAVTPTATLG
ncbi:uracil-DNA glycosylase family protein [Povalibacter sp.]|uniref:uracil-DNA glycosylase family protein n=1 Tax=Povalibacter sp. TaxID=1962978 RepID=UPI002F405AB3